MNAHDNQLYRTEKTDAAILLSSCPGMGAEHGAIWIAKSDLPEHEFEAFARFFLVGRAGRFWARLRQAWDLLLGRPVELALYLNRPTCLGLAEWLGGTPAHTGKSAKQHVKEHCERIIHELHRR